MMRCIGGCKGRGEVKGSIGGGVGVWDVGVGVSKGLVTLVERREGGWGRWPEDN